MHITANHVHYTCITKAFPIILRRVMLKSMRRPGTIKAKQKYHFDSTLSNLNQSSGNLVGAQLLWPMPHSNFCVYKSTESVCRMPRLLFILPVKMNIWMS